MDPADFRTCKLYQLRLRWRDSQKHSPQQTGIYLESVTIFFFNYNISASAIYAPTGGQNLKYLSFKTALLFPTVSTNAFHSINLYVFYVTILLPTTFLHLNPQFLWSLLRRSNARNFSFSNSLRWQFTIPTHSITPTYLTT